MKQGFTPLLAKKPGRQRCMTAALVCCQILMACDADHRGAADIDTYIDTYIDQPHIAYPHTTQVRSEGIPIRTRPGKPARSYSKPPLPRHHMDVLTVYLYSHGRHAHAGLTHTHMYTRAKP